MKVNFDLKKNKAENNNSVAFQGYKFDKSDQGFREFEFSYPYDENKDRCYLEIYKLDQDRYGNYFSTGKAYSRDGKDNIELKPGVNKVDLARKYGFDDNQAFAYHFLLVDKKTGYTKTRVDAGEIIDERSSANENRNIFNIVVPTKSNLSKGGAMKLVIIDSQKVGYVYNDQNMIVRDEKLAERGEKGIKTVANKFGGTLAGLEYAVDKGDYDGYSRIISLPIFTDDDFTAHAYWNKNCMQMASSLGNINNYASLQRKMFAHGLNFVSDGAFVNEGLEGVHFKHILKWGDDSPYINWFRASGIKNNPLSLGVFVKNKDYISHKIVNSPYSYSQNRIGHISIKKNRAYDPKKPTYIQFFDTRLVTEEERNDNKSLIKTYSKMSTPNVYDLHSHNDSVFPYAFEINPETYNDNIKNLNKYNDMNPDRPITMNGPMGSRFLSKFRNFVVDGKYESGFETWDANPDIAKLNFVFSNADTKSLINLPVDERKREMKKIIRGNMQVQDYAISSGQYWTAKTDDILRLYVAQTLRNVDVNNPSKVYSQIVDMSNNKIFPKSLKAEVSKTEVENVLEGFYNNKRVLSNEDKKSQILEGLMNTPLDSFELGDNIVSVLASPLISKRAVVPSDIAVPRYQIYKEGNKHLPAEYKDTYEQMDKIYTQEMSNFATTVLDQVDSVLPDDKKLFDGDEVTEFGKYALPILLPMIAKYAVIKSLDPNVTVAINSSSGELSYDYKELKQLSLQGIGILNPASPKDEAQMLLHRLRKGMKNLDSSIDSEIVESMVRTLKDTNLASFQLADLIIDKAQSGLDWRIDAAKDIADVEALRNTNTNFEYTWQQVINFWNKFTQGVIKINPNAYTVAEITDEINLHERGYGSASRKFPNKFNDIVSKFQRETGMSSTANYTHWFRLISNMFAKDFEDGTYFTDSNYLQKVIFEKMVGGNNPFIRSGGLDSVMYAYTFIGNHDKPRALHCAALDMSLFYCDLNYVEGRENRRKAYQIIKDKFLEPISDAEVDNYDFSAVSPKAIAMADALRPAFIDVLNNYRDKYRNELGSDEQFNKAFIPISKAISDLAQGKFMGKRFDPDAFGVKPIDVTISMVLKQARSQYGFQLPPGADADYENDVFEAVMKPALSKVLGMMKYVVALPGMPTLFDGDDVGATGYDTKTKNMFLQGRQRVHDEWLDFTDATKYKPFIAKYKKYFDEVMAVRRNPKCNALNNGAVYTLPLQDSKEHVKVPAIFRQSPDGRMAISLFNTSALHTDHRREYKQDNIVLDSIKLNFDVQRTGNGGEKTVYIDGEGGVGIPGLKPGTEFVNAKDENDKYYVNEIDGKYFIKRGSGDGSIPLNDTTLILYSVPKDTPLTFTGRYDVKPNSRTICKAYENKTDECGKNLVLVK